MVPIQLCSSSALSLFHVGQVEKPQSVTIFILFNGGPHLLLPTLKIFLEGLSSNKKKGGKQAKPGSQSLLSHSVPVTAPSYFRGARAWAGHQRLTLVPTVIPGAAARVVLPFLYVVSSQTAVSVSFYLIPPAFLVMVPDCLSCLITDVH